MNKVTVESIELKITSCKFTIMPDTTTTVCQIVMENGFIIIGTSACVDPANFDKQAGEDFAREDAFNKVWALEGYLLKEQLFREKRK